MTGSAKGPQKVRNRRSLSIMSLEGASHESSVVRFFALAVFTGTAALLSVAMQALANDETAPD
jgi:hypothetical protein